MSFNNMKKPLQKLLITLVGGSLLIFSIIFIALPGTILLLLISLTILALEYQWARCHVKKAQRMLSKSAKGLDNFILKCRRK